VQAKFCGWGGRMLTWVDELGVGFGGEADSRFTDWSRVC